MPDIKDVYSQKDMNTLQVDRVITINETLLLNYDNLVAKLNALQLRKDANNTAIDLEIADVTNLINQCTQLKIVSAIPVSISDNSISDSSIVEGQVNGSK